MSSGAPWRDLPPHFGNWNSIYHKFRQWCAQDVFVNILKALLKALVADTDKYLLVQIDSTYCKVHQHATGARKILGEQAIGVSRGGKNTKIHALVTENFQLIELRLSGGHIHDSECAITLLSTVNLVGKTVLADKAFDSENNAVIKHDFDEELYKQRNIVERFFQRICRLYSPFIIYQHTLANSAKVFVFMRVAIYTKSLTQSRFFVFLLTPMASWCDSSPPLHKNKKSCNTKQGCGNDSCWRYREI